MFWLISAAPALVIGAIAVRNSRSNQDRSDDPSYMIAREPVFTQTRFEPALAELDTEANEWTM